MKKTMKRWCEYLRKCQTKSRVEHGDSPEALEMGAASLLHRIPDHDAQGGSHDPASETGTGGKVGLEEQDQEGADLLCLGETKPGKVDHVGQDVDGGEEYDRPCGGLVEGDVFVEGDDVAEGGEAEHRDKVATHGEQDERGVDVQHEGGRAGNGCAGLAQVKVIIFLLTKSDAKQLAGANRVVLEVIVDKTHGKDEEVQKDVDTKEELATAVVDHPVVPLCTPRCKHSIALGWHRRCCAASSRVDAHQALEAASLRLVALEIGTGDVGVGICARVWVAVGEIKSIGAVHCDSRLRRPA